MNREESGCKMCMQSSDAACPYHMSLLYLGVGTYVCSERITSALPHRCLTVHSTELALNSASYCNT